MSVASCNNSKSRYGNMKYRRLKSRLVLHAAG